MKYQIHLKHLFPFDKNYFLYPVYVKSNRLLGVDFAHGRLNMNKMKAWYKKNNKSQTTDAVVLLNLSKYEEIALV